MMTGSNHKALMRRMAGGPVRADAPETEGDLLARAFSRAAARAAQERLGLPLAIGALKADHPLPDEMPARLPENGVCLRLSNPSGARGVALLSPELVGVLLETYLTGAPGAEPAPPRPATRTDVAILRDWLDRMLADLGAALAPGPETGWLRGWRHEAMVPDSRQLPFMLADGAYEGFSLPIAPESQPARAGALDLVFERHAAPRAPAAQPPAHWQARLRAQVLAAETVLEAVLWRERVALASVAGWRPGTVLRLPGRALGEVGLEAAGHRPVATGQLGQSHGLRAMRLSQAARPAPLAGASADFSVAAAAPPALGADRPKADDGPEVPAGAP